MRNYTALLHKMDTCSDDNILFSYGVVLKELSAPAEARKMFIQSISLSPLLWASWRELAKLCEDRTMVRN